MFVLGVCCPVNRVFIAFVCRSVGEASRLDVCPAAQPLLTRRCGICSRAESVTVNSHSSLRLLVAAETAVCTCCLLGCFPSETTFLCGRRLDVVARKTARCWSAVQPSHSDPHTVPFLPQFVCLWVLSALEHTNCILGSSGK